MIFAITSGELAFGVVFGIVFVAVVVMALVQARQIKQGKIKPTELPHEPQVHDHFPIPPLTDSMAAPPPGGDAPGGHHSH